MAKNQGPVLVTFLCGLVMLISFYFGKLVSLESMLYSWSVIVSGFAAILGIASLTRLHLRNLRKPQDRVVSAVLLVVMWGIILLGIKETQNGSLYQDFFNMLYSPVGSTTMSLLAFSTISAAYRALRPKNLEAIVLLLCALIAILSRTPWHKFLGVDVAVIGSWLNNVPSNGAARGILLSAGIGAISMSLRVMFGIERKHFAGGAEE